MEIPDGRRNNKRDIYNKNHATIRAFYENNREGSMADCSRATGLSYPTVNEHTKALKVEWAEEARAKKEAEKGDD